MNEIHILMFGGKRCGKTTVLSSMYAESSKALDGAPLKLILDDKKTEDSLSFAAASIKEKMEMFRSPLTRVEVDDNPSIGEKVYSFILSVEGGNRIPFCIHDIPGEWLEDDHMEDVKALVEKSQIIMIAIDTPYLFSKMTIKGYGDYHEEYNKPLMIANFFKNSISVQALANRMILFVPIKCERYYHLTYSQQLNIYDRNYMEELVDAISAGYQDLLLYLRSTPELYNNCTLAITPILSAGGIDFVRFRTDEETGRLVSLYQEPEFLPDDEKGYSPRFCEQPMLYALIHILKQTRAENPAAVRFFWGRGLNRRQLENLDAAIETLRQKIKRNSGVHAEDGYYIIQNPMGI